jgi:hypothetical protein
MCGGSHALPLFAPQPLRYGGLQFFLRACTVEKIDRFSMLAQGNVAAQNFLVLEIFGAELYQNAITAWLWRLK